MVAPVTVPLDTVLHAAVTHCVRVGGVHGFGVVSPLGSTAGNPALLQSIARLEDRTFDQGWPYAKAESNSERVRNLIFTAP
jgi:hypothetical protein